jgi:hypothetical protein
MIALAVRSHASQEGKTSSSPTAVTAPSSSIPAPILPGWPNGTEAGSKVVEDSNVVDHVNIWASEDNDIPATGIWLAATAAAAEDATDDADAAYTSATEPVANLEDTPTDPGFDPPSPSNLEDTPTDPGFDPPSPSELSTSSSDASADAAVSAAEAGELDSAVSEVPASGERRLRSR